MHDTRSLTSDLRPRTSVFRAFPCIPWAKMIKGDGIFWTLAAEFSFYLLLPMIIFFAIRFGFFWLVVGAAFYFIWYYLIVGFGFQLKPLMYVDIAHKGQFLDVFICGILGASVRQKLPEKTVALFFWLLVAITLACVSNNFLGADRPWYGMRNLSLLYGVVFTAGIVQCISRKPLSQLGA